MWTICKLVVYSITHLVCPVPQPEIPVYLNVAWESCFVYSTYSALSCLSCVLTLFIIMIEKGWALVDLSFHDIISIHASFVNLKSIS